MAGEGFVAVVRREAPATPAITAELTAKNDFYIPNIIGQSFLIFIVTAFILIKCVVRRSYLGIWSLEDWLLVLSWAMFIVMNGFSLYTVAHGGGTNQSDLPTENLVFVLYWNNVMTIVYSIEAFLSKSAVLVTYMKIFASGHGKRDWWMIVGMIILNLVFYLATAFVKIFACTPRQKIWLADTPGECRVNQGALWTATSVWNTLSDIAVLALPALFVWRLKLKAETKWQIIGIFTLGAVAYPILSIVGIILRVIWAYQPNEQTYYVARLYIFAEAEIAAGLICACLPSVSFLIRRIQTRGQNYTDIERRRVAAQGAYGKPTAAGPDTQHLDVVLDNIDAEGAKGSRRAKWLSRTSMHFGKDSTARDSERSINGMDVVADLAGDVIWKTTEVSVRYDPRKTPQYRSRANSSERTIAVPDQAHRGSRLMIKEIRRDS